MQRIQCFSEGKKHLLHPLNMSLLTVHKKTASSVVPLLALPYRTRCICMRTSWQVGSLDCMLSVFPLSH